MGNNEILPAIRKHGGYLTPAKIEEVLSDPDTIIAPAQNLKTERAKRAARKLKRRECGYVSLPNQLRLVVDSILTGNYAKLLNDRRGHIYRQNRLFDFLRASGYLISGGARHNVPLSKHIENGYFVTTQTLRAAPRHASKSTRSTAA